MNKDEFFYHMFVLFINISQGNQVVANTYVQIIKKNMLDINQTVKHPSIFWGYHANSNLILWGKVKTECLGT